MPSRIGYTHTHTHTHTHMYNSNVTVVIKWQYGLTVSRYWTGDRRHSPRGHGAPLWHWSVQHPTPGHYMYINSLVVRRGDVQCTCTVQLCLSGTSIIWTLPYSNNALEHMYRGWDQLAFGSVVIINWGNTRSIPRLDWWSSVLAWIVLVIVVI